MLRPTILASWCMVSTLLMAVMASPAQGSLVVTFVEQEVILVTDLGYDQEQNQMLPLQVLVAGVTGSASQVNQSPAGSSTPPALNTSAEEMTIDFSSTVALSGAEGGNPAAFSEFILDFTLDAAHPYSFSNSQQTVPFITHIPATLTNQSTMAAISEGTGILGPGTYRLYGEINVSGPQSTVMGFDLQIGQSSAAVPEPASLSMMGLAAVTSVLTYRRKRRRRSHCPSTSARIAG